MKNVIYVIKILVFLLLLVPLVLVVDYLCKPVSIDYDVVNGFYAETEKFDIVYLGGSACFVYYQPLMAYEEYGISSYNFASNTMQAEAYKFLISEVLKKQNPRLLIIDARAFQYRDVDQPPTEVAYRNFLTGNNLSLDRYKFIEENVKGVLKEEDTLPYHLDFIKFHSTTSEERYTPVQALKALQNTKKQEYKGFYFNPRIDKLEYVEYQTDKETKPSLETQKILEDLLDYLQGVDSEVLFVVSPYIEQRSHKEVFNYVQRMVEERGFKFLDATDYRKEMKIDYDNDFYNENHVNIFGSNKYTKFLSEYLKANYDLRDIRKNEDYESLLPAWHTKKDSVIKETKERKVIQEYRKKEANK